MAPRAGPCPKAPRARAPPATTAAAFDDFLPIAERPEWASGVTPRPPPRTPQPVVAIERDELMGDLMDYFWGAVQAGERSERVLALTGEIICDLNSSNYSVWEWRWRCLEALGGPAAHAAGEKALTRSVATANPKNYQLWNYRRRLALALGAGPAQVEEELEFAAACLTHDAKNYHAWAHRQALFLAVQAAEAEGEQGKAGGSGSSSGGGSGGSAPPPASVALWAAELAYTERLLRDDVRNNSAWNQRLFVLRNAPAAAVGPPAESYDREVDFTAAQTRLAPHNESAWEALRSLAAAEVQPGAPRHALAADSRYMALCREVLEASPGCPPALTLLADVFLAQAALLGEAAAAAEGAGDDDMMRTSSGGEAAAAAAGAAEDAPAQALDRRHAAAAAAEARRLARLVLERLAVADPIKRPYLRLELAALAAS